MCLLLKVFAFRRNMGNIFWRIPWSSQVLLIRYWNCLKFICNTSIFDQLFWVCLVWHRKTKFFHWSSISLREMSNFGFLNFIYYISFVIKGKVFFFIFQLVIEEWKYRRNRTGISKITQQYLYSSILQASEIKQYFAP